MSSDDNASDACLCADDINNDKYTVVGLVSYSLPTHHTLYTAPKKNCVRIVNDYDAKICYQRSDTVASSNEFTFCRITRSPDWFTRSDHGITTHKLDAFHLQCCSIENALRRNLENQEEHDAVVSVDDEEAEDEDDVLDISNTSPAATPMGRPSHGAYGISLTPSPRLLAVDRTNPRRGLVKCTLDCPPDA